MTTMVRPLGGAEAGGPSMGAVDDSVLEGLKPSAPGDSIEKTEEARLANTEQARTSGAEDMVIEIANADVTFNYLTALVRERLSPFDGSVVAFSARNINGHNRYIGPAVSGLLRVRCFLDGRRPDLDHSRMDYVWPETPNILGGFDLYNSFNLFYEDIVCTDGLPLPDLPDQFPVSAITTYLGGQALEHSAFVVAPTNVDALAARELALRAPSDK